MNICELTLTEFKRKAAGNDWIVDELKKADYAVSVNHAWESSYILYLKDGKYLAPTVHIEQHGSFIDVGEIKEISSPDTIKRAIEYYKKNLSKLESLISAFDNSK